MLLLKNYRFQLDICNYDLRIHNQKYCYRFLTKYFTINNILWNLEEANVFDGMSELIMIQLRQPMWRIFWKSLNFGKLLNIGHARVWDTGIHSIPFYEVLDMWLIPLLYISYVYMRLFFSNMHLSIVSSKYS